MCTVSWAATPDGYELFCNRDERHTRQVAQAPSVSTSRGVRFLAPTDGEAGGTWIAANEYGLTLCLLNRHALEGMEAANDFTSRGLLLPALLSLREPAEVMRAVAHERLSRFRPFKLLAVARGAAPRAACWTGRCLLVSEDEADALMPLTSSSFKALEVARVRRELFRSMTADSNSIAADLLARYHHSHEPEPGPLSVCMHRPDASTVSFSRVRVNSRSVEFYYQPGPPCAGARGMSISLPRAAGRQARRLAAARSVDVGAF